MSLQQTSRVRLFAGIPHDEDTGRMRTACAPARHVGPSGLQRRTLHPGARSIRLLAQTFTDFELIISDNASTDGPSDLPRIRTSRSAHHYIRNPRNLGPAANYNVALDRAAASSSSGARRTTIADPNFLKLCVDALDANPDPRSSRIPRTKIIDGDGTYVRDTPTTSSSTTRASRAALTRSAPDHHRAGRRTNVGRDARDVLIRVGKKRRHVRADSVVLAAPVLMGGSSRRVVRVLSSAITMRDPVEISGPASGATKQLDQRRIGVGPLPSAEWWDRRRKAGKSCSPICGVMGEILPRRFAKCRSSPRARWRCRMAHHVRDRFTVPKLRARSC